MLYEGDEISIFGKLVYDVKNDEFAFDRVFSMFQGSKFDCLSKMNWDWWWNVLTTVGTGCLVVLASTATFLGVAALRRRFKQLADEKREEELKRRDAPNQIPDAPLLVRKLPKKGDKINLD